MLSAEQNRLITEVGPGTPAGDLLRNYWQPVALTDELEINRPVKYVRMFGEDLVLFKDEKDQYGLMDRHCPHRGADLCFGRLEDGGLRCPFHGWLFDISGQCLEMPAEPPERKFHEKMRTNAYPCIARSGIIFAYFGEGDAPPLPAFDCFEAPEDYTFAFKGLIECNWLQAVEVGIDPAHASFLHRFFEDEDPDEAYGKQFRDKVADTELTVTKVLREHDRPSINVDETDSGMRLTTLRDLGDNQMHVRITNLLFPNAFTIPMSAEMNITQWHVPVDDTNNYWFAIFTSFGEKVDREAMRAQRLELYSLPDYIPNRNKSNDYGFDPDEQKTATYTGMGMDINTHDQWAVESQGLIQDRTKEHLGTSDIGITRYRKMLINAINTHADGGDVKIAQADGNGHDPKGPVAIDAVAPADNWQERWRALELKRREKSGWAKNPW